MQKIGQFKFDRKDLVLKKHANLEKSVHQPIWTIPWIDRFKLIWEGGTATIEVGDDVGATTIGFKGLGKGGSVCDQGERIKRKEIINYILIIKSFWLD